MKKVIIIFFTIILSHYCLAQFNLDPVVLYKLHLGLSEPSNDFEMAQRIGVLTQLAPGASDFAIMKKMENGISENNYLHKTLQSLRMMYGTNRDYLGQALVASFGLTYTEASYFLEGGNGWIGYLNDTNIFEEIGYSFKLKRWINRDGTVLSEKDAIKRKLNAEKLKIEQQKEEERKKIAFDERRKKEELQRHYEDSIRENTYPKVLYSKTSFEAFLIEKKKNELFAHWINKNKKYIYTWEKDSLILLKNLSSLDPRLVLQIENDFTNKPKGKYYISYDVMETSTEISRGNIQKQMEATIHEFYRGHLSSFSRNIETGERYK